MINLDWLKNENSADQIGVKPKSVEAETGVPQEVIAHLQENLVKTTNQSSICVDGGYRPDEAMGELARPGADLGISLALMALGFSAKDAFEAVYEYRAKNRQKYGWHTDNTEGHGHGDICGCGHCNKASSRNQLYGLNEGQAKDLLAIVRNAQEKNPSRMRFIRLNREHQEQGILQVESTKVTVLPWDQKTGRQFFVYDHLRDVFLLKEVASFAKVEVAKLVEVVGKHTVSTLGLLGTSQGAPIYSVREKNGIVSVALDSFAPSL